MRRLGVRHAACAAVLAWDAPDPIGPDGAGQRDWELRFHDHGGAALPRRRRRKPCRPHSVPHPFRPRRSMATSRGCPSSIGFHCRASFWARNQHARRFPDTRFGTAHGFSAAHCTLGRPGRLRIPPARRARTARGGSGRCRNPYGRLPAARHPRPHRPNRPLWPTDNCAEIHSTEGRNSRRSSHRWRSGIVAGASSRTRDSGRSPKLSRACHPLVFPLDSRARLLLRVGSRSGTRAKFTPAPELVGN